MNYLMQLLPLLIALALFGFACRRGYNKKTLIIAAALSVIAGLPTLSGSFYLAIESFVLNFTIFYVLIEGVKWIFIKGRSLLTAEKQTDGK